MGFMTAKEKMALLSNATSENIHEIKEKIITDRTEGGLLPALTEDGYPIVRLDIREYLRRRMKEEGVSHYKMAQFLGKFQSNFSAFINKNRPMPLEDIERMLWVLDGKAWADEDVELRTIKTTRR